jgi:hypothetical protein
MLRELHGAVLCRNDRVLGDPCRRSATAVNLAAQLSNLSLKARDLLSELLDVVRTHAPICDGVARCPRAGANQSEDQDHPQTHGKLIEAQAARRRGLHRARLERRRSCHNANGGFCCADGQNPPNVIRDVRDESGGMREMKQPATERENHRSLSRRNPGADRSRSAPLAARPHARGQRLDPLLNRLAERLRSRDRRVIGGLRGVLGVSAALLRRLALRRRCAFVRRRLSIGLRPRRHAIAPFVVAVSHDLPTPPPTVILDARVDVLERRLELLDYEALARLGDGVTEAASGA